MQESRKKRPEHQSLYWPSRRFCCVYTTIIVLLLLRYTIYLAPYLFPLSALAPQWPSPSGTQTPSRSLWKYLRGTYEYTQLFCVQTFYTRGQQEEHILVLRVSTRLINIVRCHSGTYYNIYSVQYHLCAFPN